MPSDPRSGSQRAIPSASHCVLLIAAVLFGACTSESPKPAEPPPATAPPSDQASSAVAVDTVTAPKTTALNTLTEAERAEGWRLLFDGRTLDGWRGIGRDSIPEAHWIVENGTIRKVASRAVPTQADGQPLEGGDLMTVDTFDDFELMFEWRISPGGNSGVKYNVSEELSTAYPPEHAALGFEYQILDDDQHPDRVTATHRATALYDLIAPGPEKKLRRINNFNASRIVFVGNHGEHWLNGKLVLTFDLDTPRFETMLAKSKYASIEGFADRRGGHIVLQDHGDDAWFRNIKVRDLSPEQ